MSTARTAGSFRPILSPLLIAGLVGGLAEVVWIAGYSAATPLTASEVSRQIVESVAPAMAGSEFAPLLGLGIHMGLSALLGLAFGLAVWRPARRRFGPRAALALAIATLAGIWALNFLLILPTLNPGFVDLMPAAVTLTSKLLFAVAMARMLLRRASPRQA